MRLTDLMKMLPGEWNKVADEGSTEPYYARLWSGILSLRDSIHLSSVAPEMKAGARSSFDDAYGPALDASRAFRDAAMRVVKLVDRHRDRLARRQNWCLSGGGFQISDIIDSTLSDGVSVLPSKGVVTLKSVQRLTKLYNIDIGCLFAKKSNFEAGIARLGTEGHGPLADYLREVRQKWSESFIARRDALEHAGWSLPPVSHVLQGNQELTMVEPSVEGEPVSTFAQKSLNRVLGFVEDVVVYALSTRLEFPHIVVEIPTAERNPDIPERFRRDFKTPSNEAWRIRYRDDYGFV